MKDSEPSSGSEGEPCRCRSSAYRVLGDAYLRKGAMRQRAAIERDRREDPAVRELEVLATLASGRSPSDGRAEPRVSQ
jgi:hypothetical protein